MRLLDPMDCAPCASLCEGPAAAPCAAAPEAAPQPGSHLTFLQNWTAHIAPKLQQLLTLLAGREVAQSCAIAQIWTYLPVLTEGRQVLKAEHLCLLGDAQLQAFHAGCSQEGVTVSQLGPMGKVWESGAVQVVQCADGLSEDAHPRNRLPGNLSRRIAECIYVPVYDRTGKVSQGVLAVVELLVRAQARDYMVVANAISCLAQVMEALQLSISNPHQQGGGDGGGAPLARSAAPPSAAPGGAKRGAAQLGGGGGAGAPPRPAPGAHPAAHLQHSSSGQHNNAGWGGGAGGGLGRSVSMRTFG